MEPVARPSVPRLVRKLQGQLRLPLSGVRALVRLALQLLLFATCLVLALVAHLDRPESREALATLTSRILAKELRGRFYVTPPTVLGWGRITIPLLRAWDPEGRLVIEARDLQLRYQPAALLREVVLHGSLQGLEIDGISIESLETTLFANSETERTLPSLVSTFATRSAPSPSRGRPSEPFQVHLPRIEIATLRARLALPEAPPLEVSLRGVAGSFHWDGHDPLLTVQQFALKTRGERFTNYRGHATFQLGRASQLAATFGGRYEDVPVSGHVLYHSGELQGSVAIPHLPAAAWQRLVPTVPLPWETGAKFRFQGPLSHLQVHGEFTLDDGFLTITGPLELGAQSQANLYVTARSVPLAAAVGQPELGRLSFGTQLQWSSGAGGSLLSVDGAVDQLRFGETSIPAFFLQASKSPEQLHLEAGMREVGAPLQLSFDQQGSRPWTVSAKAAPFRIESAPRLRRFLPARGTMTLDATVRGTTHQVQVEAQSRLDSLDLWGQQLQHANLTATATVPLANPRQTRTTVRLRGEGFSNDLIELDTLDVELQGNEAYATLKVHASAPQGTVVEATSQLELSASRATDTQLLITRGEERASLALAEASWGPDKLRLRGGKVTAGDGEATFQLGVEGSGVHAEASARSLPLHIVADLLGHGRRLVAGTVDGNVSYSTGRDLTVGSAQLQWQEGSLFGFAGLRANLVAALRDRNATVVLGLAQEDFGSTLLRAQLALPQEPLNAASLEKVTGFAEVELQQLSLRPLNVALINHPWLRGIDGTLKGLLTLRRDTPHALPQGLLTLRSEGLVLRPGSLLAPSLGERIEPIVQLSAELRHEGANERLTTTLAVQDPNGPLLQAHASTTFHKDELAAPEQLLASLAHRDSRGAVEVPNRRWGYFPPAMQLPGFDGLLGATLRWTGPPLQPRLDLSMRAADLVVPGAPLDVRYGAFSNLSYDASNGQWKGSLEGRTDALTVLLGSGQGVSPWSALQAGDLQKTTGDAALQLLNLQLQRLPGVAQLAMAGTISGGLQLKRRPDHMEVVSNLVLGQLTVRGQLLGDGSLWAYADSHRFDTRLRLGTSDGLFEATAKGDLAWHEGMPRLGTSPGLIATLWLQNYQAAVLTPLLHPTIERPSGILNCSLSAAFRPDSTGKLRGHAEGSLTWAEGQLYLPDLGDELRGLDLSLTLGGEGSTTIIESMKLAGSLRSNRRNLTLEATGRLEDLGLVEALGTWTADGVPLVLDGLQLATMTGNGTVAAKSTEEELRITLGLPVLHAQLTQAVGRKVTSLEDDPTIAVRHPLRAPVEGRERQSTRRMVLEAELGRKVRVSQGNIDIYLGGSPRVELEAEAILRGSVTLRPGGRFVVLGKPFEVDGGEVVFLDGDGKNPQIDAVASWKGREVTVFAEVHGRAQEASLTLRSEPPLSEPEIMRVLLGASERANASEQDAVGTQAGAMAFQALRLGEVFAGTILESVSIRTDTVEGRPTYAAAVRVSDNVWLEGIYRQRTQSSTSTSLADNKEREEFAAAASYRFADHWETRGELGNASSSLDLMWKYDY